MRKKSCFAAKLFSFALTSLFVQSAGPVKSEPVAGQSITAAWCEDIDDDPISFWLFYSSPGIEDVILLANAGRNSSNNQSREA
jgi:hypothetical protein